MLRSLLAALTARARTLRYSYFVLPGAVALVLAGLGLVLTTLERAYADGAFGGLFPAGPSAARNVLGTIAGSLITVAGLSFSITIVSLQLVSQQFTPRALRTFLGDRLNQIVAGVFVGVFLYCLVVMRSIGRDEGSLAVGLSVTVAFALAFVALALLLVFINHMAQSIQVSTITAGIAKATLSAVDRLYPETYGEPAEDDPDRLVDAWHEEGEPALVHPSRPGFVQSLDDLPGSIGGSGFRIALLVAPGDFVTEEHPLAAVWTDADSAECARAVGRAIFVASERDLRQDAAYGVRQLADIAVKALSPSVNDPTTATTCIGYLQAILERLAERPPPARIRHFPDDGVTIVFRRDEFADYLDPIVQIGRYSTGDARVVHALARALLRVAQAAQRAGDLEKARAARDCGRRVVERAEAEGSLDSHERATIRTAFDELADVAAGLVPAETPRDGLPGR